MGEFKAREVRQIPTGLCHDVCRLLLFIELTTIRDRGNHFQILHPHRAVVHLPKLFFEPIRFKLFGLENS